MACCKSWMKFRLDFGYAEYLSDRIVKIYVCMHRKMTATCSATDVLQQQMISLRTRSISWIDEERAMLKVIRKRRLTSIHARSKKISFDEAKIDSHKMSVVREGSPDCLFDHSSCD